MVITRALTEEEFLKKLHEAHGDDFVLLTPYTKNSAKIKLLHKPCGNIIEKTAAKMINKQAEGCYICSGKNWHKTTESFQKELDEKFPGRYTVLTEYKKAREKLLVRNNECGHEYMISPDNLLRGKGCPLEGIKNSKYARFVDKYLKDHKIEFEREKRYDDCVLERPLPFDFYLPQINMCIEVDGEFHYVKNKNPKYQGTENTSLEKVQLRDSIKTKYCTDNRIKLLRLPYFEFKNFEEILDREVLALYVNAEVTQEDKAS